MSTDFSNEPWIGVDFDGTMVTHSFPDTGQPVQRIVNVVKTLLHMGIKVKVMTARVGPHGPAYSDGTLIDTETIEQQRRIVEQWCIDHLGEKLEVTATKDFCMLALIDDRAIQVTPDTGLRADGVDWNAFLGSMIQMTRPR